MPLSPTEQKFLENLIKWKEVSKYTSISYDLKQLALYNLFVKKQQLLNQLSNQTVSTN
jgi:hypothetical protein